MSFLASEFGISLNKKSDRYLGYLRMSQVNALMAGYTKLKEKEVDAVNRRSNNRPGRYQANSVHDLKNIPGVKVKSRAR